MPHRSQRWPAAWFLCGSYVVLICFVLIFSAFSPEPPPRTGLEKGVSDMVILERFFFILIPCWLGGSLVFLGYLLYEKARNQRKLFSKSNLDQGLIHLGFLVITMIIFSLVN